MVGADVTVIAKSHKYVCCCLGNVLVEANVLKFRNQLCCMLWRQDDDCGAERIDSCSKTKSPTFSWDSSLIHQDAPGKHSENTTTSDTFYATERHDDIMLGSILSAERFQMVVPSNRDAEEVQHCKLLQPTCDFPVLIKILSSIRIVTRRKRLTNDPFFAWSWPIIAVNFKLSPLLIAKIAWKLL